MSSCSIPPVTEHYNNNMLQYDSVQSRISDYYETIQKVEEL